MELVAIIEKIKVTAKSLSLLISAVNLIIQNIKNLDSPECKCEMDSLANDGVVFFDNRTEKDKMENKK